MFKLKFNYIKKYQRNIVHYELHVFGSFFGKGSMYNFNMYLIKIYSKTVFIACKPSQWIR